MPLEPTPQDRDTLRLVSELARSLRCCQQEEAFCAGVTFNQFVILDLAVQQGRLRLAQLHGLLAVDKSTTTRLVKPLVERGLLRRERSARDGRAVELALTPSGRQVHGRVWGCLADFMSAVEVRIPEERRAEVFDSVRLFTSALRQASGAGACLIQGERPEG